jgi:hypothetical protein
MRLEWTRRRAGWERRQHRRFDFDVAMVLENATEMSDCSGAPVKHFTRS